MEGDAVVSAPEPCPDLFGALAGLMGVPVESKHEQDDDGADG